MTGAWLPPKRMRRPPPIPPVGTIAPGVAFVTVFSSPGHFMVIDRVTGELLGIIWRTGDSTWSVATLDGRIIAAGLRGTRHDIGIWLQRRYATAESGNQNGDTP